MLHSGYVIETIVLVSLFNYPFVSLFVFLSQRVEVPVMLRHLRQQRMLMVQTVTQYKFVYQVLIQFLKNTRLI